MTNQCFHPPTLWVKKISNDNKKTNTSSCGKKEGKKQRHCDTCPHSPTLSLPLTHTIHTYTHTCRSSRKWGEVGAVAGGVTNVHIAWFSLSRRGLCRRTGQQVDADLWEEKKMRGIEVDWRERNKSWSLSLAFDWFLPLSASFLDLACLKEIPFPPVPFVCSFVRKEKAKQERKEKNNSRHSNRAEKLRLEKKNLIDYDFSSAGCNGWGKWKWKKKIRKWLPHSMTNDSSISSSDSDDESLGPACFFLQPAWVIKPDV